MKNKADINRIVEAVKAEVKIYFDPIDKSNIEKILRTALEGVELEGVCEDCNGSGQVPFGEEQGQILYEDCPCVKDHPSEREVLIEFAKSVNDVEGVIYIHQGQIDRYLKEKGTK